MITIACLLWDHNAESYVFSRYTNADVVKLYRGFQRHLTQPFRFVCFVDYFRDFGKLPIEQELIDGKPGYGSCVQPYRMDTAMILVGLDTVIVGNVDHLATYALDGGKLATPRDPFFPETVCNGVQIAPAGSKWFLDEKPDGRNDMDWMREVWRRGDAKVIDDLWPGEVVSYKGVVRQDGLDERTRIVYFHGREKPRELPHVGWIYRNWHALGEDVAA